MSRIYSHSDLERLPRAEIQNLARRECIKANGKSTDIISQLLKKYPEGVPMDLALPSTPPPINHMTSPSLGVKREAIPLPRNALNVPRDKSINLELSHTTQATQAPFQAANEPLSEGINKGLSTREVRAIRNKLTKLVNTNHQLRRRVAESEALLAKSFGILNQINVDLNESTCLRAGWESQLMRQIKDNRAYYDGTGPYPPGPARDKWETWLMISIIESAEEEKRVSKDVQERAQKRQMEEIEGGDI